MFLMIQWGQYQQLSICPMYDQKTPPVRVLSKHGF